MKRMININSRKKIENPNILQKLTLLFFDNARFTISAWIAVLIFGALSYAVLLNREGFPNVSIPVSVVQAQYFVNNSEKVDQDVARPLSKVLLSTEGVRKVAVRSFDNFATFIVEYEASITSESGSDMIRQTIEREKVLPSEASLKFQIINATKFNNRYDILTSVYSESLSAEQIMQKAQFVAEELNKINEVQTAEVIDQFSSGVNPNTGEVVRIQSSFDRVGFIDDLNPVLARSVVVGVIRDGNSDALSLSDEVNKITYGVSGEDWGVIVSADFAEGIRSQVSTLQSSLSQGLLIVLVVSFLLISWRAGVVTALSMASVLAITVGLMYFLGLTLNTITLFALILCIGLIIDDTIIMVEALDAARRSRKSKRDTVSLVTKKIGKASLAGSITTVLGFAPLLFISGILGEFIRVLPITIILSLIVSLIVSLTLVPLLSRYIILGRSYGIIHNPVNQLEALIGGKLSGLIKSTRNNHKRAIMLTAMALLLTLGSIGGAGYISTRLKFDIFPSTKDADLISIQLSFEEGATLAQAESIVDSANEIIIQSLGSNFRRLTYSSSANQRSASAIVDLSPMADRSVSSPEIINELQYDLEKLENTRARVVQIDAGPPRDEFPFKMQVFSTSKSAREFTTLIATELQLENITRPNEDLISITETQITPVGIITRDQNRPYIQLDVAFSDQDTSAVVNAIQGYIQNTYMTESRLAEYGLTAQDIDFDFGVESDNQDSFRAALVAFPVLIMIMYLLLLFQFKSLSQPLLIFLAVPFSFFGVTSGLYLTSNPLSFFVMVALFALIGIAVNNTILLTEYANQARARGLGRIDAISEALLERFRPLITTSLTSIVALLPLALTNPFWESLAYTLIFGLLSSTLLVLLAFPYYYLAFEWVRIHISRKTIGIWIAFIVLSSAMASVVGFPFAYGALTALLLITTISICKYIVVKTKQS